jgi:predicted AAA+ superfamily ATPase
MLERKITAYLEKWLTRNTVLLVDGVRQAGKSYAIREFGKVHFGQNFFEFNFHEHRDLISDFNRCKTAQELITNLSLYSPRPFVPGKTLIFLDEIQLVDGIDWPMFSKYLLADGRFRFVLSGSLLGVTMNGL